MANSKNTKSTEKSTEKEYFSITGMKVTNVRRIGDTGIISFSLQGKGLGLYNLKIVKGAHGEFIAAPSTKGKDGAWYPQYAVYLTDDDAKRVIGVVKDKLPSEAPAPAEDTDF